MKEAYIIEDDLKRKDFSIIEPKLVVFEDLEKESLKIIQKYFTDGDITLYRKSYELILSQKANLVWDIIYKKMDKLDSLIVELEKYIDEDGEVKKNISHSLFFQNHSLINELNQEIEQLIEGIDQELKVHRWLSEMEQDLQVSLYN